MAKKQQQFLNIFLENNQAKNMYELRGSTYLVTFSILTPNIPVLSLDWVLFNVLEAGV